jgi:tetratricopeptide (TPR) repeat protein
MEPDSPATAAYPVTKLQAARARRGWSQTQVVARLRHAAASAGVPVPDDASLKTQLSRWERGAVRRVSSPYRMLLRMVYGLTDTELGLLPAEPPPFRGITLMDAPRMTPEISAYYESLFAEHVRADNLIGPRLVLDLVSHQAETLRAAVRQTRGAERELAVLLASRYEEFLGWLNQDAGHLDQAMIHTDRARDLAIELRDPLLATYLLMRKSNIATDSGDSVLALALADAALSQTEHPPPNVRAVVLRQKALALAGLGQEQACDDVAAEALETVAAPGSWPEESSLAPYCTTNYVAMEAAACWLQLNQPERALAMFSLAPTDWPTGLRRDHGLHLARRAAAHAGVGDVGVACDLAEQSIRTVRQTGSARTIRELRRLAHQLTPWQARSDVMAVAAAVATLVRSGA